MKKPRFSPTICLTHDCNLHCVYCYQEHDKSKMDLDTAIKTIDYIFSNVPANMEGIEIGFIGGEPLLEFELIKSIVEYTCENYKGENYIFYATTNGTLLDSESKNWFERHKSCFVLGLSIDGTREVHNHNRSNSFDKIDFDFFVRNWPNQSVKMTLTEKSLEALADNIISIHELGFMNVGGVNLFEGDFDWSNPKYIKNIIPQLEKLVEYYIENSHIPVNQMLDRRIDICESTESLSKKWCGIGDGAIMFDVDGEKYPCPYVSPMTFEKSDLDKICYDMLNDDSNFVDEYCNNNCYIHPVCPNCAGANLLNTNTLNTRNKSKCSLQKIITIYAADLLAKKIVNEPNLFDESRTYRTIEAIKKIKSYIYPEFKEFV